MKPKDRFGDILGTLPHIDIGTKSALDAICCNDECVAWHNQKRSRAKWRNLVADDATAQRNALVHVSRRGFRSQQHGLNVTDADPRDRRVSTIEGDEGHDGPTGFTQACVASLDEGGNGLVGMGHQDFRCRPCRLRRLRSVSQSINDGDQNTVRKRCDDLEITGLASVSQLPERTTRRRPLYRRLILASYHAVHFFIVMVVPAPGEETSSKSSMSRLAPGSPNPRLLPVE